MEEIKISDIKDMSLLLQGIDMASMEESFKEVNLNYMYKDDSDFKLGYQVGKKYAVKNHLGYVNGCHRKHTW